jgi:DNA-binding NarL/FixJ family response regulator
MTEKSTGPGAYGPAGERTEISMTRLRILMADDHRIMREGLRQLFALMPDIEVVGEATSGAEVLDALRQTQVDLLLLDMTMPGLSGDDLITRVRAHYPALPILVLSMHEEPQIAQRALKAGANGYLTKDQDSQTLLAAVRKVAAGGRVLDPLLAERMAFEVSGVTRRVSHDALTNRELEVMRLLAKGLRVGDIAQKLSLSDKTISTHKARLMEKMGFTSSAELVRYAIDHGLVE